MSPRTLAARFVIAGAAAAHLGCSSGGPEPAGVKPMEVLEVQAPAICPSGCACLGVGAFYRLEDAMSGVVRVDATIVCGFNEAPAASVLIEPLDDPCDLRVVPLTLTDIFSEMGGFEGQVDLGGRPARLSVVQGVEAPSPSCRGELDGCIDLGLANWALSETVDVR
jgi:hypothetical protein